jgi:Sulfotransferase domain
MRSSSILIVCFIVFLSLWLHCGDAESNSEASAVKRWRLKRLTREAARKSGAADTTSSHQLANEKLSKPINNNRNGKRRNNGKSNNNNDNKKKKKKDNNNSDDDGYTFDREAHERAVQAVHAQFDKMGERVALANSIRTVGYSGVHDDENQSVPLSERNRNLDHEKKKKKKNEENEEREDDVDVLPDFHIGSVAASWMNATARAELAVSSEWRMFWSDARRALWFNEYDAEAALRARPVPPRKHIRPERVGKDRHKWLAPGPMRDYRAPTMLVSFPRSGNTWLRSLVERATGVQTNSIYCDGMLLTSLGGECSGVSNSDFVHDTLAHAPAASRHVMTKTHVLNLQAIECDGKRNPWLDDMSVRVVQVVRNPFDNLLSRKNFRLTGSHTSSVSQPLEVDQPSMFELRGWTKTGYNWLHSSPVFPHYLVRYEDLKLDTVATLRDLTHWLGFNVPEERLRSAIGTKVYDVKKKGGFFVAMRSASADFRVEVFKQAAVLLCLFGYDDFEELVVEAAACQVDISPAHCEQVRADHVKRIERARQTGRAHNLFHLPPSCIND